ncbi:unnamed protein product [Fraxinus pennsylvanica]|uniref:ACT domain-containing protein n=1 Tax=Fraxinus pennsylvanica TaxID=56036 RepID=A0AAD1Z9D3_9LAMI|nr:unnamed protein product [Fraxinus pennsylvanica]
MKDKESCSSRVEELVATKNSRHWKKVEVYNEVLRRLKDLKHPEAQEPDFDDQLWAHFNRLPARYAMDVNVEKAEDVITHKRLLHLACNLDNRPAFEVRLLQLTSLLAEVGLNIQEAHAFSTVDGYSLDVFVFYGWPYEVSPSLLF